MSDHLDFDKLVQEYRGAYHECQLKFQANNIVVKNKKTSKLEQVSNSDIENVCWLRRAKGHCVKIVLKNGTTHRFDGFQESDLGKLEEFARKTLKRPIDKTETCIKGWNWGKTHFVGDSLSFEADGKLAFEIPLKNVSNTNVSKNEAILQFHQNEEAQVSMMEIRFHIPNLASSTGVAADMQDADPAQEFVQNILAKADIQSTSDADAICTLTELNCITPRGRYDVKFFTDFIDLHGKTFDYKISYDHILRLFLLPHKDGRQMFFVMAMDPPMKQGNTRYPFLIVMFNNDDNISVDMNVSEKTKEKFGDKLDKLESNLTGPYHEVVSRICRSVLDKKITVPGTFTTASGGKCYPCSCKANSGFLYPLERGFIFVNKPPVHILFSDIAIVRFDRSQGGTRSFDFEIEHTNGTKYVFSGIDKTEQEKLQEFIKSKSIRISKSSTDVQTTLNVGGKKDHDAYAERMKAEGREKDEDDDDDDEEDDEDFEAGSDSDDDDIEYDSNASISGSSDGDASGSGSGSGSDDDDDGGSAKKKKKRDSSPKASKHSSSSKEKSKSSSKEKEKKSSSKDKEDKEDDKKSKKKKKTSTSPPKRSSSSKSTDKSKASTSGNTSKSGGDGKTPKSAEFIEDGDTDSD